MRENSLTWEAKAQAVTRVLNWTVKRGPKPDFPPAKDVSCICWIRPIEIPRRAPRREAGGLGQLRACWPLMPRIRSVHLTVIVRPVGGFGEFPPVPVVPPAMRGCG